MKKKANANAKTGKNTQARNIRNARAHKRANKNNFHKSKKKARKNIKITG